MKVVFSLFLIIVLFGCNGDGGKEKVNNESKKIVIDSDVKNNYIILLDLSDRIISYPDQITRDKQIIKAIFESFKTAVKKNYYIKSSDKFQVLIAEQNDMPISRLKYEELLRLNLEAISTANKKKETDKFSKRLGNTLDELYESAAASKNPSTYKGTKIWKYFNEGLETDIIQGKARNRLFIITDGYLDFEDPGYQTVLNTPNRFTSSVFLNKLRGTKNWEKILNEGDYGLVSINKVFPNLSVMVLEMNPKYDFIEELAILQKMWDKWLIEMGSEKISAMKRESISSTTEAINNFIKKD